MKGLDKAREGADVDEVLEDVVAARRAGTDPKELFGGPRDWVDTALPPASFAIGNIAAGLRVGILAAIAAEVVVIIVRLLRRETLRHAFSGAVGVLIGVLLARRYGAKGFFLGGLFINASYGTVFVLSAVFRHPLVGIIMRLVWEGRPKEWHQHPKVKRAYIEATIGWALMFFLRFAVQAFLYQRDEVGWLAATKIAMGYPLFIALLAITVPYVKWRTQDVPVPESPAEAEAEDGGTDTGEDAADGVAGRGGA